MKRLTLLPLLTHPLSYLFLGLVVAILGVISFVIFFHAANDVSDSITGAVIASGGNVSEVNLTANASPTRWAGIYGKITVNTSLSTNSSITLTGGQLRMKNITLPCYADKLYAATSSTVDWDNVQGGTPELIDNYLGITLPDAESATEMFNASFPFAVLGTNTLSIPSIHTLIYNSTNQTFSMGILNNSRNLLLVTALTQNQTGFDNRKYDYQMLLPIPSAGTTYRLFADCGACVSAETSFSFQPINFPANFNFSMNNTYQNFSNAASGGGGGGDGGSFASGDNGLSSGTISSSYLGMQPLKFNNATHTFLELEFDFGRCQQRGSLGGLIFERQNSSTATSTFLVRGITLPLGETKTIYLDNQNASSNSICIKDAEISAIGEISNNCSQTDETRIYCSTAGTTKGGYTCTDLGKQFKITGAEHSGVTEITDNTTAEEASSAVSAVSGGAAGGGSCPPQMTYSNGRCVISLPKAIVAKEDICAAGFARIGGICLQPQPLTKEEGLFFDFSISLSLEEQNITFGEKNIFLNVKITKLTEQFKPINFLIYYEIIDKAGRIVLEDTSQNEVLAEASFVKELNMASLSVGEYNVTAYAIYQNQYARSQALFIITPPRQSSLAGLALGFLGNLGTYSLNSVLVLLLWFILLILLIIWGLLTCRRILDKRRNKKPNVKKCRL